MFLRIGQTVKILLFVLVFALFQAAAASFDWTKRDVKTLAWLRAIHFADAETGWIGGSGGTLLKTSDGGESWRHVPKFTSDTILEIVFTDKNTGWLLCERDVFNLGTKAPTYLLKTKNGGETWVPVDFAEAGRQRITKIFFAASGFGLAVGETGVLYGLEDDNESWKKLSAPSRYLMLDGVFTDDLRGTIVGGGGTILFTEDAGASWNPAFVAGTDKTRLNSVFFINRRNGWAVGAGGKIYQTINGGRFWRLQKSNTGKDLTDVFFINTAEGWAIGDAGTILHTTTAGNVWREVAAGGGSTHKFEKIHFNNGKGWIVGFGGTLLFYNPQTAPGGERPRFRNR